MGTGGLCSKWARFIFKQGMNQMNSAIYQIYIKWKCHGWKYCYAEIWEKPSDNPIYIVLGIVHWINYIYIVTFSNLLTPFDALLWARVCIPNMVYMWTVWVAHAVVFVLFNKKELLLGMVYSISWQLHHSMGPFHKDCTLKRVKLKARMKKKIY